MKITKSQLRQVIKEELRSLREEEEKEKEAAEHDFIVRYYTEENGKRKPHSKHVTATSLDAAKDQIKKDHPEANNISAHEN